MKSNAENMANSRKNLQTLKRNLERAEQEYKKLNP